MPIPQEEPSVTQLLSLLVEAIKQQAEFNTKILECCKALGETDSKILGLLKGIDVALFKEINK